MRRKQGTNRLHSRRAAIATRSQVWTILSAISQLVFASLAVFGYFYTVRPIYQNQFLSEQKAKLELDGSRLRLENAGLVDSAEESRRLVASYNSQISELRKKLAEIRISYGSAIDEKNSVQKELGAALSAKKELDKNIQSAKAAHVLESFLAYVAYRGIGELTSYTSSLDLIKLPMESDLDGAVRLFLGEPYADTKELIQTFFEGNASGYLSIGIKSNDPIKALIGKLFMTELDKVANEIEIPDEVFLACKEAILEYRAELARIEAAKKNLSIKDYKAFEEYQKRSSQLLDEQFAVRSKTMKLLDDIKTKQYDKTAVFQLIVSRLRDNLP